MARAMLEMMYQVHKHKLGPETMDTSVNDRYANIQRWLNHSLIPDKSVT